MGTNKWKKNNRKNNELTMENAKQNDFKKWQTAENNENNENQWESNEKQRQKNDCQWKRKTFKIWNNKERKKTKKKH